RGVQDLGHVCRTHGQHRRHLDPLSAQAQPPQQLAHLAGLLRRWVHLKQQLIEQAAAAAHAGAHAPDDISPTPPFPLPAHLPAPSPMLPFARPPYCVSGLMPTPPTPIMLELRAPPIASISSMNRMHAPYSRASLRAFRYSIMTLMSPIPIQTDVSDGALK